MRTHASVLSVVVLSSACAFSPVDAPPPPESTVAPAPTAEQRCAVPARLGPAEVQVDQGRLRGASAQGVASFLGVPYAAAPTGERRFRAPASAACWDGVRDATAYGSRCAQPDGRGGVEGAEDCLVLNVWAPDRPAAAPRPVLVWVHGGDNVRGAAHGAAGSANLVDGAALAASRDAVVVTLNFRLGALGFLAHPDLSLEGEGAGNLGLLDVRAALEWVRRNAAAFGGDASQVLLFGEGSGALDVCALLAMPRAQGLFQAALLQSGACEAGALLAREEVGRTLVDGLGCGADAAACLRRAPLEALVGLSPESPPLVRAWDLPWGPVVDGDWLPRAPREALATGQVAAPGVAVGHNAQEFELFLPPDAADGCDAARALYGQAFGALAPLVEQRYPCGDDALARATAVRALTDAVYACPARRAAREATRGGATAYRYLFAQGRAHGPLAPLGAYHSAELPVLFGTLRAEGYAPTPADERLGRQMQDYWTSLPRGAPASPSGPAWTRYLPSEDNALVLAQDLRLEPAAGASACDFWDAVAP